MRRYPKLDPQSESDGSWFSSISCCWPKWVSMDLLAYFIPQIQPDFFLSGCRELETKVIGFNDTKFLTNLETYKVIQRTLSIQKVSGC